MGSRAGSDFQDDVNRSRTVGTKIALESLNLERFSPLTPVAVNGVIYVSVRLTAYFVCNKGSILLHLIRNANLVDSDTRLG